MRAIFFFTLSFSLIISSLSLLHGAERAIDCCGDIELKAFNEDVQPEEELKCFGMPEKERNAFLQRAFMRYGIFCKNTPKLVGLLWFQTRAKEYWFCYKLKEIENNEEYNIKVKNIFLSAINSFFHRYPQISYVRAVACPKEGGKRLKSVGFELDGLIGPCLSFCLGREKAEQMHQ